MPTGRSMTSYDVYRDYNCEDLMNDMYPLEGAVTPAPGERYTPINGHRSPSPGRPKTRLLGRPTSRFDVSVQDYALELTESKHRPIPQATQRDYAIPETMGRPTSPVARLLERYPTSPSMSLRDEMDPITRQYYNRLWRTQQTSSAGINLNRQGRAGGVWRHVRACVANTGTQLAFIDGTVKQEDNIYFPPHKRSASRLSIQQVPNYVSFRQPQRPHAASSKSASYGTKFNSRAKGGFKYWYQEPKPIDLRGDTTRLRARMVGNGY